MLSKNNIENVMQMPRLSRIDLNTGVGKGVASIDRKQMIGALFTLEFITGQKPSITRAKKSIDKFKLREKMMIGCKVTLRKKKMFFFLDRLVRSTLTDQGSSFALQSKG
jgi:large subunit ribosomal protein L5